MFSRAQDEVLLLPGVQYQVRNVQDMGHGLIIVELAETRASREFQVGKRLGGGGISCPIGVTGHHIFLSYRRIDSDKARTIEQALTKLGYKVCILEGCTLSLRPSAVIVKNCSQCELMLSALFLGG